MADLRLLITRKEVTKVNYQYLGAFRLRIEVTDPSSSGADPNVFIYNQRPINPYDQTVEADFLAVASPVDMAEYPAGEPRDGTEFPFFRLDYVELDFRSTAYVEKAWGLIVAEVSNLLAALNRLEALEVTEELWVGAPLPESDSASASASA